MNYDINCISMNMDIRKNQKGSLFFLLYSILLFFFFRSYSSFFYVQNKKGLKKKIKGLFRF